MDNRINLQRGNAKSGAAKNRKIKLLVRSRHWRLVSALIILGVFLVSLGYLAASRPGRHQRLSGAAELKQVETRIGRHYLLPADETPALVTVTDSEKLTSRFLKNARNGDKILVYQNHQVAIIYRPSIDRIVAVGPVIIDNPGGDSRPL
jgi:hypothetical protein